MYITIYFADKRVVLCNEIDKELNEILHHPDAVFVDELSPRAIKSMLHEIKKDEFHAGVIWHPDLEKLKQSFFKNFTIVDAAGGIVQNENKDLLFIYRRNKWDLPKGKMEMGETAEICAEREIEEETGVKKLLLKYKIGETYHIYEEMGKTILKISHWFYFITSGNQKFIPQTAEDITEVKWIHTRNIKEPMANTHQNIKDILTVFFDTP